MRRIVLFAVVFAFSLLMGIQAVEVSNANPNWHPAILVPAPQEIKIILKFESPKENGLYSNGTIKACFNVTLIDPNSLSVGLGVTIYRGDWMQSDVWCPYPNGEPYHPYQISETKERKSFLQYNFSINEIPSGRHRIEFKAHTQGSFMDNNNTLNIFNLDQTLSINFSLHLAPSIKPLIDQSPNVTFSSFPLNFTVDQPTSWLGYSIDNLANVTIDGNTTLTGLSAGNHSLFVFGNNTFGDMAKSETINFAAKELENSLALAVVAPVIIAIIISLGLLVYFRRRGKP
jgi:hypothetical protein